MNRYRICQHPACGHAENLHDNGVCERKLAGFSCMCSGFKQATPVEYIDRQIDRMLNYPAIFGGGIDNIAFVIFKLLETRDVVLYGAPTARYTEFSKFMDGISTNSIEFMRDFIKEYRENGPEIFYAGNRFSFVGGGVD